MINSGSTRPLHITRITLRFGGYCIRDVPAKSAAAYEHQLHKNPMILGSYIISPHKVLQLLLELGYQYNCA